MPIRVDTLDGFRLQIGRRREAPPARTNSRPLRLLTPLIALGGAGVADDSLCEHLWTCLQLGRRAEGLEAYRRCCEALRRGLSAEPSRESVELSRELQARGPEPDGPEHDGRAGIAVLPFRSPQESGATREFADGIAEDLMTDLARISLLAPDPVSI